ncbi:MAG TPA: phage tail protein, partial [Sutterellaceae bacterium]|nr:phage tail protein [Sutterellaceae bacterium]
MVPESNRKAGPFTGTGQTQFDFDFYMLSADDVVVIVADADEKETTLSKDAYTCTLNSDQNTTPGGRVTLKTALASGHKLAICSGVPYTQNLNLTMYGSFSPTSINKEEDRRVIQLQQILEQMRRCLIVPITSEKTPQEVMTDLLDVAEKAADYAQRA